MSKLQYIIVGLIAAALALPVVMCVLIGLAALLSAMSDVAGATVLYRVCIGFAVVWVTVLVGLLITVAMHSLDRQE